MKELRNRLTKELQQDFNIQIKNTLSWHLPMQQIEVDFETITKTKMDILMKMMLISFQKAEIETAQDLSEILLVEQLFIEDLINKMTNAGMIVKDEGIYALTRAGRDQLETGIFEHEAEEATIEVIYSPCHQAFFQGDLKDKETDEQGVYRYQSTFSDWRIDMLERSALLQALKDKGIEKQEGNLQLVVSKVKSATSIQAIEVSFIEFHLYNQEEDIMYARVWNTLSGEWDKTLEEELNEKERKKWRIEYLNDDENEKPANS